VTPGLNQTLREEKESAIFRVVVLTSLSEKGVHIETYISQRPPE